jgi:phage N-6-adenine-methyltransferase
MEFRFTLDAAASPDNALCERYYTAEDDALTQEPEGEVIWCNPPYGHLDPWIEWFTRRALVSRCTVVALLPSGTDTDWFAYAWWACHELRLVHRRIRFLRPDGTPGQANTTGSVIVVWRPGIMRDWAPDSARMNLVPPRVLMWYAPRRGAS